MSLSLQAHAAPAEGAPYACPLAPGCTSTFKRKADKDRHWDDIHLGKKVQCPVEDCPQQVRKDKLSGHVRDKHPGHLNPSARRSRSGYLASNNNSDSQNGNPTASRQTDTFEDPPALEPNLQIETLRRFQAMECLCAYLRIDLLPGEPEALRTRPLAGVNDQPSNPSSMLNGVNSGIESEVLHFVATRLSPHVFIQPYPASYTLAPPQRAFSCHSQLFSTVPSTSLTHPGYSDASMRATRDLLPSPMPYDAAHSSTEIPISVFGDAQSVPVQRSASGQEYGYGSQVVPSTINEPPVVTTRHSPTHVATDQSSDITARYIPPNLGHDSYTPATFTPPLSYTVEESPPDCESAYLPPSVAVGFSQILGHTGEHNPPDDDYTYTSAFNAATFGQSPNLNIGDSLPYQDEMNPQFPSAETSPSNTDPRPYLARASPSS